MAVTCAACDVRITDRYYLLAVDREWHMQCLKCSLCKEQLDSQTSCFSRNGNIYCKVDYYKLFASKNCARCHLTISATELVMRAREYVYHLHCFTCATCNKTLAKGEYFGLRNEIIYCRLHYELLMQYEFPTGGGLESVKPLKKPKCEVLCYFPVRLPDKSSNERTDTGSTRDENQDNGIIQLPNVNISTGHQMSRPKRLRTSFKHNQIRTMKSYFSINHNPDAKDLKQLSQKTGLSKRVLQVWFQNARAKWRRNLLRQQTLGPEVVQDSKPLVEMTSQERHCTPLLSTTELLEVQPTPITQVEQNFQSLANML
ncbi:LIM/homeobox protein Lhx2-like [Centruroides vittatus]|uniref:LIM/homeobox protein Lhx2-like n=1 Tax=Centruroides vittatus TaxID=120091 RepID=UPI00350ED3D7